MIQKIHELHPDPLALHSLELAMTHGTLELVQWIIEHRHDRLCCAPGIKNLCGKCLYQALLQLGQTDSFRVVTWLADEGFPLVVDDEDPVKAESSIKALLLSLETTLWYEKQGLLTKELGVMLLKTSLSGRAIVPVDVTKYHLTTNGRSLKDRKLMKILVHLSCQPGRETVVDLVLSTRLSKLLQGKVKYCAIRPGGSKVLQWSRAFIEKDKHHTLVDMSIQAASLAHFDTVQWLYEYHNIRPIEMLSLPPSTEADLPRFCEWKLQIGLNNWNVSALVDAARSGYLQVVQWLHIHSLARRAAQAMDGAAANGHLHVVQWLHENRSEGCTNDAFFKAATGGHLEVVKWLYEHYPKPNTNEMLGYAAVPGPLEVLEWLHDTQADGCTSCVVQAMMRGNFRSGPVLNPIDAIRWLDEHSPLMVCEGGCPGTRAVLWRWMGGILASDGDLQFIQYITEHHPESEPANDRDEMSTQGGAVGSGGHLPLMQWMYERPHDATDWTVARMMAKSEDVRAWLDSVIDAEQVEARGDY